MAKRFSRPVNKEESTDFSFANSYIEERKYGKWRRIEVNFPFSDDRAAGNIDYESQDWHRSYRGHAPKLGQHYNNLQVKEMESLDAAKYRFINNAKNGSNVPEGYYATNSGISLIVEEPFSSFYGEPTDNPIEVNQEYENNTVSGEFFVGKNIRYSNPNGETEYYTVNPGAEDVGRFEWSIKPDYQAPVEPEVRFPNGAIRKKFFRNS